MTQIQNRESETRNVVEAFKATLEQSNLSHLEMSWSMEMDGSQFKQLLSGEVKPTEKQELDMLRFIFKSTRKPAPFVTASNDPLI